MINLDSYDKCCGCGNCEKECPKRAITLLQNEYGFIHAQVDNEKCVDCGLCEKVCSVLNHCKNVDYNHTAYIAYAKDKKDRFNGSSGGMFGSISKWLFNKNENNQIVYGASFDSNLNLMLTSAKNENELIPLYKSKYLQSDLGDTYFEIKRLLEEGVNVMFTATPCQVYALKLFLKKEYDNLITVDFICHGVPSQNFFDKCKEYVEKRDGIKILDYQFRAKKNKGSTPHYYKITYLKKNKKYAKIKLYTKSPFYLGFQKYISLRDSCYNCQFAGSNRCSDITIGDFHDVDKYVKGINRFDGVSFIAINSEKGKAVFEGVKDNLVLHELNVKNMIDNGEIFNGGTKEPSNRTEFIADLKSKDFDFIVNKYLNSNKEWKKDIYYKLPRFIREVVKKFMGV